MRLPETYSLPFPVFMAGADGRIQTANAAFERLLPDRVGTPWMAVFPDLDPDAFSHQWERVAHGDAPLTVSAGMVTTGDQTRFFDVICQPLLDSETDPLRLLGVLVDVTAQTQQEAENAALLDTAVDAIVIIDDNIQTTNLHATPRRRGEVDMPPAR